MQVCDVKVSACTNWLGHCLADHTVAWWQQQRKAAKGGSAAPGGGAVVPAAAVCPLRAWHQCHHMCPGYVAPPPDPAALAAAAAYAANPNAVHDAASTAAWAGAPAVRAGPTKPQPVKGMPYFSFTLKAKVSMMPRRVFKYEPNLRYHSGGRHG